MKGGREEGGGGGREKLDRVASELLIPDWIKCRILYCNSVLKCGYNLHEGRYVI